MSSGQVPQERRTTPHPFCPRCKTPRMRRLPREGFWQQKFWPLFHIYPWECPYCRRQRLVRARGKRGEYAPPPQP